SSSPRWSSRSGRAPEPCARLSIWGCGTTVTRATSCGRTWRAPAEVLRARALDGLEVDDHAGRVLGVHVADELLPVGKAIDHDRSHRLLVRHRPVGPPVDVHHEL